MNKPARNLRADASFGLEPFVARPSIERKRVRAFVALFVGDVILLYAGFILAGLAYEGVWLEWRAMMQAGVLLPAFFTIALYSRTYQAQVLESWLFGIKKAAMALAVSTALVTFIAFYAKSNATFSRGSFTLGILFTLLLLAVSRWITVRLVRHFWDGRIRNQLVINDGGPDFTLECADHIVATEAGIAPLNDEPFMRDRLGRIVQNQDRVIVSCPPIRQERWAQLLRSSGVRGEIVSEPLHAIGAVGVFHYEAQKRSTLQVSAGPLGLRARAVKRLFDIAAALTGLILLSPLFAFIALRIKLEDGGSVFFVQRRTGRSNCFFNMVKFRTMRVEALDPSGARSTARNDDRITRYGGWLRAMSVDELPQLWNVLKGDMSIVGPRPHAPASRANDKLFWDIDLRYYRRHSLRPGMTGLAQVRGLRGATEREQDLTDRLQSDLEYISNWSLFGDMLIVVRTLKVLRHERAF